MSARSLKPIAIAAAGILITVVAVAWIAVTIDWAEVVEHFRQLSPWVPFAVAGVYLSSFFFRGWRWHALVAEPDLLNRGAAASSVWISFAANNLLPFRLGEVVRAFVTYQSMRKAFTGLVAKVVIEKVLDGIMILIVLAASCFLLLRQGSLGDDPRLVSGILLACGLFGGASLGLIIFVVFEEAVRKLLDRWSHVGLIATFLRLLPDLSALRNRRLLALLGAQTLAIWIIEGLAFGIALSAFGLSNPWIGGFFVMAIVNLGILVPSAPGYVGVFQAAAIFAFALIGYPGELALSVSIVVHLCQFLPVTLVGIFLLQRNHFSIASLLRLASGSPKPDLSPQ